MGVYVKGGLVSLALVVGLIVWYLNNQTELPVQRKPEHFKLIDQMEKSGVPTFSLKRLDGSEVSLEQFKGKVIIINFWASWCNPCVEEFPSLIKLIKEFKGDVVLLAVSNDDHQPDIEAFLKAFGLPQKNIEILWDQDRAVANKYGVVKIPESFIVGKDLRLVRKVIGIDDWATAGAFEFFRDLVSREVRP